MAYEQLTAEGLREHLQSAGRSGIALDIDDTLCYTDRAWWDYMIEAFADPQVITREQLVEEYGWFEEVPHWNHDEGRAAVQAMANSNEFSEKLDLIEGVDAIVRDLHHQVPLVAYITARPATVWEGTARWLAKHNFPDLPIVFRTQSNDIEIQHYWKADVLMSLYPHVTGIVDDQPRLARQLAELGYKGKLYLYDNGSGIKPYGDAERYRRWDEIRDAILAG